MTDNNKDKWANWPEATTPEDADEQRHVHQLLREAAAEATAPTIYKCGFQGGCEAKTEEPIADGWYRVLHGGGGRPTRESDFLFCPYHGEGYDRFTDDGWMYSEKLEPEDAEPNAIDTIEDPNIREEFRTLLHGLLRVVTELQGEERAAEDQLTINIGGTDAATHFGLPFGEYMLHVKRKEEGEK